MFARVWAVFSFVALLMWRFAALRWQAELSSSEESAPLAQTGATPEAVMAPASWKVSVAVVGLWALAIGSSLPGLASPLPSMICSAPIGADKSCWFVLLLPPVMFAGGAWFMKRGPFAAPWLAALVDEKVGAGSYENFLVRLKPLLLMSAGALAQAAVLAVQCSDVSGSAALPISVGFMVSGSVAFALAHCVLRWRQIPGV